MHSVAISFQRYTSTEGADKPRVVHPRVMHLTWRPPFDRLRTGDPRITSRSAPTVFVIDDDADVRSSIQGLLKSAGIRSESFETAEAFLRKTEPDGPSCLVLDVSLPGVSGLELQQKLVNAGVRIPIIFLTGHGDIPMT